nr:MAG TPA: hypothetical protein [Caudoviricetes sp.]
MLISIIFFIFSENISTDGFHQYLIYKGVGYYFNETRKFINLCL